VRIADPGIRESFAEVQRRQSATAAKVCALHANSSVR
jgi:hypothetical protein